MITPECNACPHVSGRALPRPSTRAIGSSPGSRPRARRSSVPRGKLPPIISTVRLDPISSPSLFVWCLSMRTAESPSIRIRSDNTARSTSIRTQASENPDCRQGSIAGRNACGLPIKESIAAMHPTIGSRPTAGAPETGPNPSGSAATKIGAKFLFFPKTCSDHEATSVTKRGRSHSRSGINGHSSLLSPIWGPIFFETDPFWLPSFQCGGRRPRTGRARLQPSVREKLLNLGLFGSGPISAFFFFFFFFLFSFFFFFFFFFSFFFFVCCFFFFLFFFRTLTAVTKAVLQVCSFRWSEFSVQYIPIMLK